MELHACRVTASSVAGLPLDLGREARCAKLGPVVVVSERATAGRSSPAGALARGRELTPESARARSDTCIIWMIP